MPRRIESHLLDGPAGRLEAQLEEPEDGSPREACLVCHPHPLGGGTMLNKVVYRLARGLRHSGSVVLRFNFRGVGRSEGRHDQGVGEVADAQAALTWLRTRYPHLPYSLAGFSFGARVALELSCRLAADPPRRIVAAGYSTRREPYPCQDSTTLPRIFIQSTVDEYGPREELEALFATLPEPKRLIFLEAKDHFFDGALELFEQTVQNLE